MLNKLVSYWLYLFKHLLFTFQQLTVPFVLWARPWHIKTNSFLIQIRFRINSLNLHLYLFFKVLNCYFRFLLRIHHWAQQLTSHWYYNAFSLEVFVYVLLLLSQNLLFCLMWLDVHAWAKHKIKWIFVYLLNYLRQLVHFLLWSAQDSAWSTDIHKRSFNTKSFDFMVQFRMSGNLTL